MYRWYENAKVCYAYLHDVPDPWFPTTSDHGRYYDFLGRPGWFSRGWTLQELIAPDNVQFFNKDWQCIGDKRTLAPTLQNITGVPEHILVDGLHGNRPCVAQIMSWAGRRKTTRVEDRAYSLMGLLGVNMSMLYGEGKKAFHRLQLEIIRASNDQSIFAWYCWQRGSIFAGDPSFFEVVVKWSSWVTMNSSNFSQQTCQQKRWTPSRIDSAHSRSRIAASKFGCSSAPIAALNLAWLPCRLGPMYPPVTIDLVLWESNYYRCFAHFPDPGPSPPEGPPQFHLVYLRYQAT